MSATEPLSLSGGSRGKTLPRDVALELRAGAGGAASGRASLGKGRVVGQNVAPSGNYQEGQRYWGGRGAATQGDGGLDAAAFPG